MTSGKSEMEGGVVMLQEMIPPLSSLNEDAKASFMQLTTLEETITLQAQQSQAIRNEVEQIDSRALSNKEAISAVTETTRELQEMSQDLATKVQRFELLN
jgi:methyl-accepting chemotaxis protein